MISTDKSTDISTDNVQCTHLHLLKEIIVSYQQNDKIFHCIDCEKKLNYNEITNLEQINIVDKKIIVI